MRSANVSKIRKKLAQIYAPLLEDPNSSFNLEINGQRVQAQRHCHWDPSRVVQGPDGRPVHAVESFDIPLSSRRFCTQCMISLRGDEEECPTCESGGEVEEIRRRLRGWVGIQRYLDEDDYGIDLVRNGRVIEARSKELFICNDGEKPEKEYPIDDQRYRGRFIGEVHMDHCRVHYTKDRFEREDPAWLEMVHLVRGQGPMQPRKRAQQGFPPCDAPLHRLFQVFRRNDPHGRNARWDKLLVVKDNERAKEMADLFQKGDPEYQSDEKWWELVQEQDRSLVSGGASGGISGDGGTSKPLDLPEGLLDEGETEGVEDELPFAPPSTENIEAPPREKLHTLSRTYTHPHMSVRFPVEAFSARPDDPDIESGAPWQLRMDDPSTHTYLFLVQLEHAIFRSTTMTPLDALLTELTLMTYEHFKDMRPRDAVFASILADFRHQYAQESQLHANDLIAAALATFRDIGVSVAENMSGNRATDCFDSLPGEIKSRIRRRMATAGVTSVPGVIEAGEFLKYAEPEDIRRFVVTNPALFFDGHYWDSPFYSLDFGDAAINEEARSALVRQIDSYLQDAIWLTNQAPADIDQAPREVVIRAAQSIRLLAPDCKE